MFNSEFEKPKADIKKASEILEIVFDANKDNVENRLKVDSDKRKGLEFELEDLYKLLEQTQASLKKEFSNIDPGNPENVATLDTEGRQRLDFLMKEIKKNQKDVNQQELKISMVRENKEN